MLNQYLNTWEGHFNTRPSPNFNGIMGLPDQTNGDLFLGTGTYSLWNREAAEPVETGKYPSENTYGSVPFVMGAATANVWFGLYSNVAAAQDWEITNEESSGLVEISMFAAGGRGDITVIQGADPNAVVSTFHNRIVGLPVLPPQWALGFHQSRTGYKDTAALSDVVANYTAAHLPLDAIWSDIDYMEDFKNFYIDNENYGDLPTFIKTDLKDKHWVPVVSAAIPQRIRSVGGLLPYLPYHDGLEQNIFLNASAKINQPYTGAQYADDAVYVDWSHENATVYWGDWLAKLQSEAAFDGLWLDMNEATSFCEGACFWDQKAEQPVQQKLKYIPTGRNLESGGLPLDVIHADGSEELDVHSLYGTQQTEATFQYFTKTLKKRPMIVSRSAFAGQGKYGARTLGDNYSTGHYMGYSITGVMASNIAGTPLAGADICGYNGNVTDDLCARWYTVGSFYPFSRNHNSRWSADQEPYLFTKPFETSTVTYLDIIRNAMFNKMSMIKYYYSELHHVTHFGGAFFKPLFFDYPNDQSAYLHQVRNAMIGNHIKLGVLSDFGSGGTTNKEVYFPKGTWCDVFNRKGTMGCAVSPGQEVTEQWFPWSFYLSLREGSIIPFQDAKALAATSVAELQTFPVELHILANCTENSACTAQGVYFNDDGETLDAADFNQYGIMYTQPQGQLPSSMTLSIPNKQKTRHINANDDLTSVSIYFASRSGWADSTSTYSVVASLDDNTTVVLSDTKYVPMTDRLVYSFGNAAGEKKVSLFDLKNIIFTKKA